MYYGQKVYLELGSVFLALTNNSVFSSSPYLPVSSSPRLPVSLSLLNTIAVLVLSAAGFPPQFALVREQHQQLRLAVVLLGHQTGCEAG